MLNQIILECSIIKNEGLKFTTTGKAFLNLVLIFKTLEKKTHGYGEKRNYIRGTMWGKMAQNLCDKLHPGFTIIVRGKLIQKVWLKEDGKKGVDYSLNIDQIHFERNKSKKITAD